MTPISIKSMYIFIACPPSSVEPALHFEARSIPGVNKRLLEGFHELTNGYLKSDSHERGAILCGFHDRAVDRRARQRPWHTSRRGAAAARPPAIPRRQAGGAGGAAHGRDRFLDAAQPGLTLAGVARTLDRAFAVRNAPAVAVAINSPGGSPVQSHLIFRRIRELAQEKKRRVDRVRGGRRRLGRLHDRLRGRRDRRRSRIRLSARSVSSAVRSASTSAIAKIGIERRLYTSGEHKAMLDPFLPENPGDVERLKKLQREIHEDFIALVKSRRGGKLNGPENDLFSGEYWTGRRALELGLVDAIGDLRSVLRERFGDKVVTPLDQRRTRLVRTARPWRGPRRIDAGGACRGHDFGARSTRHVGALWALGHDAAIACPGLIPGGVPVFGKEHAQTIGYGRARMPPVLALALGLMGAAALVRWCVKEVQRVNAELDNFRGARRSSRSTATRCRH